MHKLTRRHFLGLATGSVAALLLASCTPAGQEATATAQPAEATSEPQAASATATTAKPTATPQPASPTATAAPAAAEAGVKYTGKVIIALPSSASSEEENYGFQAVKQAYQELQPDVELVWEGPSAGTDYGPWLSTQLAAGDPQLDIVPGNYVPTYGKYVNFDKYRFQVNQYTGRTWDEDLDWDFFVYKNTKGERVMLPTEAVHILWFYNKDLFAQVGVEPPATWDDLVQVCEKLDAAGIMPMAVDSGKARHWMMEIYTDQYFRDWVEIVRAQPGDYCYDPDLDGTFTFDPEDRFLESKYNYNPVRRMRALRDGEIKYDTPEMAEVIANFCKIFPRYTFEEFFSAAPDSYSLFLQGKAAMLLDGTWSFPSLTQDMANLADLTAERREQLGITDTGKLRPFEWATFENPAMAGPLVKFDVRSVESATGIYTSIVDRNAAQTELSLDFLMFWTSQPGYQAWVDGWLASPVGYQPGGPVMVRDVVLPAEMQAQMDAVQMLGNAENNATSLTLLQFAGVGDLQERQWDIFKRALEGTIEPEQFGEELDKLIADNFDDILAKSGLTEDNLDHPERQPGA